MKATIKVEKEVDIKLLKVRAGVRYWEDATVNGVEDENGDLIPFRDGQYWCPIIDVDSGVIKDWPKGTTANIHYKVCDDGVYEIEDINGGCVLSSDGEYVPDFMSPKENGDGDYIIMDVDENGKIDNWEFDLSYFYPELDD